MLQGVLQAMTANQCPELGSVTLQLPKAAALHSLSLSGECCHAERNPWTGNTGCDCRGACMSHQDWARDEPALWGGSAGCSNLRKVVLSCPRLRALSLSGCACLEHVALACPALESLSAAQLPRLEALQAPFACASLREANFAGCKSLAGGGLPCMRAPLPACRCMTPLLHMKATI
jgi:hypothetical protein